jgi:hypothetical protein
MLAYFPEIITSIEAREKYDIERVDDHSTMAFYLLSLKESGAWRKYFDTLPQKFEEFPIFWNEFEECTMIEDTVNIFKEQLKEQFKKANLEYECNEFLKSRTLVTSRAFGANINEQEAFAMVPFGDFLNHG